MAVETPLVAIVVDDSADDELVSVIAAASNVPAVGYSGAWLTKRRLIADDLTIKFVLTGPQAWRRQWSYHEPPEGLLAVIGGARHHVAVLPREIAGNPEEFGKGFSPKQLEASIIVEAPPAHDLARIRAVPGG
jgi:hypothetical protein